MWFATNVLRSYFDLMSVITVIVGYFSSSFFALLLAIIEFVITNNTHEEIKHKERKN